MKILQCFVDQISIKWLARGFWGDEEIIWGFWNKTWGMIFFSFFLMKILGDDCGGFGRRWRKNCGSEVCRSLSWKKYKNNPLCNVFRKAKYLS